MLSRLADKFVLKPKRFPIPVAGKQRRLVAFEEGHLEVWTEETRRSPSDSAGSSEVADLYVLKLVGAGGRAEIVTEQPFDIWKDLRGEVWAMNPPGFGCSSGRATLRTWASSAVTVFQEMERKAEGRPILISANSLGTASALHIASVRNVAGLILRNPPPLRKLIVGMYGWWNLGVGAQAIAAQIPDELDSIASAKRCQIPAIFITSEQDQTVPPRFQQLVWHAYAGPQRRLSLRKAGHGTPMSASEASEYGELLHWLRDQMPAIS